MRGVAFLLVLAVTISGISAQEDNLVDLVNGVFGTQDTSSPTTTRRPAGNNRGFGVIVEPDPIVDPTTVPQILVKEGRKCTCVPYYLCNPDTNSTYTDGSIDGFGLIDIRFDPDSCQDVLDVCCAEGQTSPTPITPTPSPSSPTGCGIRHIKGVDFQIAVNTNSASEFAEFPWAMALMEMDNRYFCSGALIHPQVVLTGQHCVIKRQSSAFKVRAGEWDTQTNKERLPFQERNIRQIINHPEFNDRSIPYDFSLLVLDTPFALAEHINTVCLPPQDFVATSPSCFSMGWGKDVFGQAGKYSVILKKVPLPMVPRDKCERDFRATRLGPRFNLHPTFVCAGGQKDIDTCQGDGGAPLVCPIQGSPDNRYHLTGLVAWGIGCREERAAAYANVAAVRNWIDQHMNTLGFGSTSYEA